MELGLGLFNPKDPALHYHVLWGPCIGNCSQGPVAGSADYESGKLGLHGGLGFGE